MAESMVQMTPGAFLKDEIRKYNLRLLDNGQQISTSGQLRDKWAQRLYEMVDGKGLKESAKVPQQHVWIQNGTQLFVWT